jgi:hypothetical protein
MAAITTDQNFERMFAEMAFASLQDKAPSIVPYVVGFQVIDADEDQSNASGVFAARIGSTWVQIPVFFNDGQFQGTDVLYVQEDDLVLPADEVWITHLINRKPSQLGTVSPFDRDFDKSRTSLRPFYETPAGGSGAGSSKYASSNSPDWTLVKAGRVLRCWGSDNKQEWVVKPEYPVGPKWRAHAERIDLLKTASVMGPRFQRALIKGMLKNAKFGNAILKHYPFEKLSAVQFKNPMRAPEEPSGDPVRVVTYNDIANYMVPGVTDDDRKAVMDGKIVVKDHRDPNSTTRVWVQPSLSMNQVTKSGFYEVVTADGDVAKAYVGLNPQPITSDDYAVGETGAKVDNGIHTQLRQMTPDSVVVYTDKPGFVQSRTEVIGTPLPVDDSKLTSLDSLSEGDVAILIGGSRCTDPFRVTRIDTQTNGNKTFYVHRRLVPFEKDQSELYESWNSGVFRTRPTHRGSQIDRIGKSMFVGGDVKVLKIKQTVKPEYSEEGHRLIDEEVVYGAPRPADMTLFMRLAMQDNRVRSLRVIGDGQSFDVSVTAGSYEPELPETSTTNVKLQALTGDAKLRKASSDQSWRGLSYIEAIKTLGNRLNIHGSTCQTILKEAQVAYARNKPFSALIKVAVSLGMKAPSAPFPMNSPIGVDGKTGLQATNTFAESLPIDSLFSGYEEDQTPDDDLDSVRNTIAQAAQTGQKEIIDTAVLGGVLKGLNVPEQIDNYLGDMILGLDRVGRVYLLFLSNNKSFAERYGQQDMLELESSLRTTFNGLGDLVMKLKQTNMESSAALDSTKVDTTPLT